jgi:hypothetical protein
VSAPAGNASPAKARLIERSAAARARVRGDATALRESLTFKRAAVGLSGVPVLRSAAVGLALSLLGGASRTSRLLLVAGRLVIAVRVASALLRAVREARATRYVRQRTDPTAPPL